MPALDTSETIHKAWPVIALIFLVLGGIYTGWLTPVEAGAAGASLALGHSGFAQVDVLERLVVDACRNWSHNGCNLAADYNGIVLQPYAGLCRVAE
jgi:hypothetical protein